MTAAALLGFMLAATPLAPWSQLDPDERSETIRALREKPLPERLLEASGRFLETPYVYSPLGEGAGKDADPTLRFDAADCLSLVEETLALTLAAGPEDVEPLLARIRYGPELTYEGRNHLMEAQWLPHAIELGILKDVTRRFGGADTLPVKTEITAASWRSPSSRALELPPERQVVGSYAFHIVPLPQVLTHLRTVPSGTLFVVVREERPFKVTRMTHLGFIVQKRRTFLRHASKSRHRRVVDEDLEEFLARNARYDKWPVSGIALYQVTQPEEGVALSPPERTPSPPLPPPSTPHPPSAEAVRPLLPGLPWLFPEEAREPSAPTSPRSEW